MQIKAPASGDNNKAGEGAITVQRTAGTRYDVPIGRYLRIAGSTKVYSVLEAKTMPAANTNYELKIYPTLRAEAAVDSRVDFTPNLLVRWSRDSIGIEPEDEESRGGVIVNYLCRFSEAI